MEGTARQGLAVRGRPDRRTPTCRRGDRRRRGRRQHRCRVPRRSRSTASSTIDFTEETGHLTPTLKVKRNLVHAGTSTRRSRRSTPDSTPDLPAGRRNAAPGPPSATRARSTRGPSLPSRAAPAGSASSPVTASGDGGGRTPVHHDARLTVQHGVRRAARIARDDRQPGRGRLQVDDAEPLDVQAAPAGTAGHREDVPGVVVRGQLLPGHRTGDRHRSGQPELGAQALQCRPVRPAADEQERGVRHRLQDPWPGVDQRVLTLARDQPRDAHDDGTAGQAVPRADGLASGACAEHRLVHSGREPAHPARRGGRKTGGDTRPGVFTQVGEDVEVVADAAQQGTRAGQ